MRSLQSSKTKKLHYFKLRIKKYFFTVTTSLHNRQDFRKNPQKSVHLKYNVMFLILGGEKLLPRRCSLSSDVCLHERMVRIRGEPNKDENEMESSVAIIQIYVFVSVCWKALEYSSLIKQMEHTRGIKDLINQISTEKTFGENFFAGSGSFPRVSWPWLSFLALSRLIGTTILI